jgi:hypothetical protein
VRELARGGYFQVSSEKLRNVTMTTFLFWNLNRNPIPHLIAALAIEHAVDVLILAECKISLVDLLVALNDHQTEKYSLTYSASDRLLIFTRFPRRSIQPLEDTGLLSIRRLIPPVGIEILLVAAHLSSKLYQEAEDQALTATRIPRMIEGQERRVGHRRTVVVGDLNMNPFETGLIGAEALHAVMDRHTAMKVSRVVSGDTRFFFYNPMWSRMGDDSKGPPGTYYRQSSRQVNYFWNTFDQVLLRPELINRFNEDNLAVLTRAGSISLITDQGIPDETIGSDHLPVLFGLDLSLG